MYDRSLFLLGTSTYKIVFMKYDKRNYFLYLYNIKMKNN